MVLFTFLVSFAALQLSQCFVPRVPRMTSVLRTETISVFRLQQQLTKIDPITNEGGETIEIGKTKTILNVTNGESFGTLHPRKNDRAKNYGTTGDVFPRASSLKLSKTRIESTVDEILKSSGASTTTTTATSMGLFGEAVESVGCGCIPRVGPVLATSVRLSSSVVARVATGIDDLDIANLRLSVFSNFNPESRKIFCERSCQLLTTRRQRGATCIVATIQNNPVDNDERQEALPSSAAASDRSLGANGKIVGSAEISFHEFSQTQLGYSRPRDSILYVTEVAVDAAQRRKGIANLMMKAIDSLAAIREVETIYLHVDVANLGAVNLYKRAGYTILEYDNPVYLEFTTKLNLHDGATKGRNHYLMSKDLRKPTWLNIQEEQQNSVEPERRLLGIEVMSTF